MVGAAHRRPPSFKNQDMTPDKLTKGYGLQNLIKEWTTIVAVLKEEIEYDRKVRIKLGQDIWVAIPASFLPLMLREYEKTLASLEQEFDEL